MAATNQNSDRISTKNDIKKITILFVHYGSDWIRGSERCLLDLLGQLDRQLFSPIVWCNSKLMADQVKKLQIEVICQDFPLLFGWQAPRYDFSGFFSLIKQGTYLVRRYQVQLIHSNSGAPCQWLNVVARKTKLPLIAHLHCRYPLRDRLSFGLHHVSQLLAVSHPVAKQYLNDSLATTRVTVVPNGIDKQRFNIAAPVTIRRLLGLTTKDFILISVGSLIERKGMNFVIMALALVRQQGVPAKLVIIGEGPCRVQLTQQIAALNLNDHVFMLGERSDIPQLLQSGIDLLVSGATEEVFGLVLAEAGLHQIPVIAPAIGGIPEVVVHNHSGLLVAPQAPHHIAQAIELLYWQPDFCAQLGQAAKKRVEQLFLIAKNTATIESIYQQMLTSSNHSLTWHSHWSTKVLFTSIVQFLVKKLSASVLSLINSVNTNWRAHDEKK